MKLNCVAAELSKFVETLSTASFPSALRRQRRSCMLMAGLGIGLAAQPNLQATEAFSLTSSFKDGKLTYELSTKYVPTLANSAPTALGVPSSFPLTWTSLPSGWIVNNVDSYSDLKRTNSTETSVYKFTAETSGVSFCTNGIAVGYMVAQGTNTVAAYRLFDGLIPGANSGPTNVTSRFEWPAEVKVKITATHLSFEPNTDMRVQVQESLDLHDWRDFGAPTNLFEGVVTELPISAQGPQRFYRAQVLGSPKR